jgi:signal transduction histidine kinase
MDRGPKRAAAQDLGSLLPFTILGLGLMSIFLWIGTDFLRIRIADQEQALTQAASEIRVNISFAHLWLEEHLGGDETVKLSEIWRPIDEARSLARAIIEGGAVGPSRKRIVPLSGEPALRQGADRLVAGIEEFRAATQRRLDAVVNGVPYGVGTPIDREFDAVFNRLAQEAWVFERVVHQTMEVRKRRARLVLFSLIGLWLTLVSLAAVGLSYHQKRRRSAEEALRKSEAQLLQAQKMEAVGRLAGGLAHDINNYVGAITAQCELVKMRTPPPEKLAAKMDLVIATAGKVTALVRRLLAFSRQRPIQVEVVNVSAVVEGLGAMVKRLLGEDLQVEAFLAPDLWPARLDPSQVEQVIVNLLVNASEASPQGGKVTIETANATLEDSYLRGHPSVRAGDYVLLAISDSGSGIPAEIHDQIFEPFFTTKEGSEARGLGLATVYAIAKQNGGHVTVYSEVGKGTTFRVYFPRSHDAAAAPAPAAVPPAGPLLGDETLLLVEDNHELRGATQGVLEALGYRVLAAQDGAEALGILQRSARHVDLVITDVVMPGMSGQQVFDRARELWPDVRVLFISGYTDNVVLRHGILAGRFDFLAKPFSTESLSRKVREVLDRGLPAAAEA